MVITMELYCHKISYKFRVISCHVTDGDVVSCELSVIMLGLLNGCHHL